MLPVFLQIPFEIWQKEAVYWPYQIMDLRSDEQKCESQCRHSYLCDFGQFSYPLWESTSTSVKGKDWKLWETGHRIQRESWTVAGFRNKWNRGGSGHLECRNDSLLRMVPLKWCSSNHAHPGINQKCQESDSQSRPSVWAGLSLLPGAGEVFCWTAYQNCMLWVRTGILREFGWK